ncbi:MAG: DNA-binding response regulator [Planctomycetota bacterium]|nr:MAG: DNA-binding response regulator [Planctomycetota bacterium]
MLVDDHPVMRVGLASVLSTSHRFDVIAQADDGQSAIDLYRQHLPDVVLLDVSMERMDGIDTLRRLRGEFPAARVLMLTSSEAPEDMGLAMEAGARGYLVKTVHHETLAAAIRAVHAGGLVDPPAGFVSSGKDSDPLSPREAEVLGLVRQGFSNAEIAALLGISERTARAHVSAILAALRAADRAQAVALGFELGILKPSKRSER